MSGSRHIRTLLCRVRFTACYIFVGGSHTTVTEAVGLDVLTSQDKDSAD